MALKMTLKLDNGLMIPDAYIKIEQIAINKETATALIGAFVDNANKIPVYEKFIYLRLISQTVAKISMHRDTTI